MCARRTWRSPSPTARHRHPGTGTGRHQGLAPVQAQLGGAGSLIQRMLWEHPLAEPLGDRHQGSPWRGKASNAGARRAPASPWTGPGWTRGTGAEPSSAGVQRRRERTHERARVRWKRWRRPRNMTKDRGGKERVDTSQKGVSKPPAGHWQWKPPSALLVQVPPLRQTPGTQRPERLSTSQFSPAGSEPGGLGHIPGQGHARSGRPHTPHPRTSARVWGRAAKRQEFVGRLGTGEGRDNAGVTQVFLTVASKLATTTSPAAQASGLGGMPAPAEGTSLDPGWYGNGTGEDWPQPGCTVPRTKSQGHAREVLAMLRVPP